MFEKKTCINCSFFCSVENDKKKTVSDEIRKKLKKRNSNEVFNAACSLDVLEPSLSTFFDFTNCPFFKVFHKRHEKMNINVLNGECQKINEKIVEELLVFLFCSLIFSSFLALLILFLSF